jgi:MtN3 and saliva related transmembrane protein
MEKEVVGIIAGILTAASLIPQLIKSIQEKKVNVSTLMFLLLMGGNGLWVVYGFQLSSWPIIITNAFAFLMDVTMLVLRFKYSSSKKQG